MAFRETGNPTMQPDGQWNEIGSVSRKYPPTHQPTNQSTNPPSQPSPLTSSLSSSQEAAPRVAAAAAARYGRAWRRRRGGWRPSRCWSRHRPRPEFGGVGNPDPDACGCQNRFGIPCWVGAAPILVYFRGDWDVHWGYGLLTHGHMKQILIVNASRCPRLSQSALGWL